ncbi:Hypothetical protein PHPALM_299 [Phytophthora palmivora]|uniref:Uncharacterized protein n=1 Tax=Phytophthora palmivora TaxID=4796 RepID=A0A2P4YVA6_9STRA|nr:Hypothetical protein PHPALM_299 [Phytophthora palmivora]
MWRNSPLSPPSVKRSGICGTHNQRRCRYLLKSSQKHPTESMNSVRSYKRCKTQLLAAQNTVYFRYQSLYSKTSTGSPQSFNIQQNLMPYPLFILPNCHIRNFTFSWMQVDAACVHSNRLKNNTFVNVSRNMTPGIPPLTFSNCEVQFSQIYTGVHFGLHRAKQTEYTSSFTLITIPVQPRLHSLSHCGKHNVMADTGLRVWDTDHAFTVKWTNMSYSWSQVRLESPFDNLSDV